MLGFIPDMAKRRLKEPKQGRGVSLRPSTWEHIDKLADVQDKSASEVIEDCLMLNLPPVSRFRKSVVDSQGSEVLELP